MVITKTHTENIDFSCSPRKHRAHYIVRLSSSSFPVASLFRFFRSQGTYLLFSFYSSLIFPQFFFPFSSVSLFQFSIPSTLPFGTLTCCMVLIHLTPFVTPCINNNSLLWEYVGHLHCTLYSHIHMHVLRHTNTAYLST